ncbi:MAG TPA: [Fe-Fe] hydrogenase large subunit C-terminal domain-containing protein [Bacteroidales bacterium]|nr:[Fe-Fe] hydrogenase large subunit C-terminal domain-containing protein [Bacteroidales bacterium]HRZ48226.1 [Fe-Fe] hydrogenase large subunit C-terminal domain-containing protein [Bacteroidales bacterium]
MNFFITVNNREIEAVKGETILQALKRAGISIPTLCNMEGFTPTGACRLCMVEVKGREGLVPSCSQPVEEWMEVKTHTPRVIKARRMIVELLLASHPDDCLYCERNCHCELQNLAFELNVRERKQSSRRPAMVKDLSSPAITRDPSKCILCGRCVRICEEVMGCSSLEFSGKGDASRIDTLGGRGLNATSCIACGQCVMVCPTGALYEKKKLAELQIALGNPGLHPVAVVDPVVSLSLADVYGNRNLRQSARQLNNLLKRCGFREVYDYAALQDLYVRKTAEELTRAEGSTIYSSNCPAWIKYAEQYLPELLPCISKLKSPSQLAGTLLKKLLPEKDGTKPFVVSFSPCTARKYESRRREFNPVGEPEIDLVITARALEQYVVLNGMDPATAEAEEFNKPFQTSSMYGELGGVSGGTMEAVAAETYFRLTGGKDLPSGRLKKVKPGKIRELVFDHAGETWRFASVSGMAEAAGFIEELSGKPGYYRYIEVMACPNGCINGGGLPILNDDNILKNRQKQLTELAEKNALACSNRNRTIDELLSELAKMDGGEQLLYTAYEPGKTV